MHLGAGSKHVVKTSCRGWTSRRMSGSCCVDVQKLALNEERHVHAKVEMQARCLRRKLRLTIITRSGSDFAQCRSRTALEHGSRCSCFLPVIDNSYSPQRVVEIQKRNIKVSRLLWSTRNVDTWPVHYIIKRAPTMMLGQHARLVQALSKTSIIGPNLYHKTNCNLMQAWFIMFSFDS